MTQFSVFQLKEQPELIKELSKNEFESLWRLTVKIVSEYEKLCHSFEAEFMRRNLKEILEKKPE